MKNHDPDYGDNVVCDACKDVFDVRNTPHETIGNKWFCESCADLMENDDWEDDEGYYNEVDDWEDDE